MHAFSASAPTSTVWRVTHATLCAGRWSEARVALDVLASRTDVADTLCPADSYARVAGVELDSPHWRAFRSVIQDRIDLVNAHVR